MKGTLRYISRDASSATRTFRIEVAIPNEDKALPAGMTAEITLLAEPTDAVMLPRSVVTLSSDGDLGIRAVDKDNKVVFFPIDLVDDTPNGLVLAAFRPTRASSSPARIWSPKATRSSRSRPTQATIKKLIGEATDGT